MAHVVKQDLAFTILFLAGEGLNGGFHRGQWIANFVGNARCKLSKYCKFFGANGSVNQVFKLPCHGVECFGNRADFITAAAFGQTVI